MTFFIDNEQDNDTELNQPIRGEGGEPILGEGGEPIVEE
jgi:hypothetical protein